MRLHLLIVVPAFGFVCAYAGCSDDTDDAGASSSAAGGSGPSPSAGGGGGGGLPECLGVFEVTGEPGNIHGTYCIACLEEHCCAELAACAADTTCLSCSGDPSQLECLGNVGTYDLTQCAAASCENSACNCITCRCEDDGVCELPGMERCDCADCASFEGCHAGCDDDGECDGTDSCACPDCFSECVGCNGDGFCDLYSEPCDCSDCDGDAACDL
jgi:hypothetical protein